MADRQSFTPLLTVKRSTQSERLPGIGKVSSPQDAAKAVRQLVGGNAYESFVTLYLNVRHTVIGYDIATSHDQTGVTVNAQGLVRMALLTGAVGMITAHQHPSGDPTPSAEDRALWKHLRAMAQAVDVTLLDNLVVGAGNLYYSETEG